MRGRPLWCLALVFPALVFPLASCSAENAAPDDDEALRVALVRGARALWDQERLEDALRLTEHAIEISGERSDLVELQCDLLFKLRRPRELLEATLLLEEISERKTPWNYLKIADAHIFLGDGDEALRWIEKAVRERGFTKFTAFERDYYDLIRDDPRFAALLAEIHQSLGVGKPARDFTATLLDGAELTLSSLRGRVALIDFWATWCAPCREELPNLQALYAEFHSEGLEIVGIGLDDPDALETARAYIEENGIPWKLALSGRGWSDEVAALYGVNGLPSTWLIDREGILRHVDLHGDELRSAVERMMRS